MPLLVKSLIKFDNGYTMDNLTSLAYIRFLNLAKAIRELNDFPALSPMEESLLNFVALAWHANKKISVSETMHRSPQMSPSSVHRHLKALRSKGFVRLQVDERDNRIKFISYTQLSEQYFSRLGQCLDVKDGA